MNRSELAKESSPKDRYYKRNVFGISSVEFTWGLGLPVVIESTFLQLFIKSLGGSSFAIGLIPTFFFIGSSIFALFSSYLTADMQSKRTSVVILHLISGFSLLVFGCVFYALGQVSYILLVFFLLYGVFSLSLGMTLPVWLNYLVEILSDEKSVSGIAFMLIAQNLAKMVGALVIVKVVGAYAFSQTSSAIVFITVGGLFTVGSLFFLITKEVPAHDFKGARNGHSFFRHTLDSFKHMFKNKRFLTFLAGDFQFYIVVTVISFYADYATSYCGIDPAIAAGLFVGCIYLGAMFANFLLGTLGWLELKQKYVLSNFLSLIGIVVLVLFSELWSFFLTSLLLGMARGSRMVALAPATKRLSGLTDSTSYFAIAPLVALPLASVLPMAAGKFLDGFIELGGDAYRIVFTACGVMLLVTLFFCIKTDYETGSDLRTG